MKSNFAKCLELVLHHEGGYVNHPKDPGGATNKGVTQKVYDGYRKVKARPPQSVKFISDSELEAIYKLQYWDAVKADLLPTGLDYAVFDLAVNSGVGRASKYLQRVLGVPQDGMIGAQTLGAVYNTKKHINDLCDLRMSFLRQLKNFATFGKGWTRRVEGANPKITDGVREIALEMAA